jgi:hypothetical protein
MKIHKTEALPPESARRNCDGTCHGDHPPTGATRWMDFRPRLQRAVGYSPDAITATRVALEVRFSTFPIVRNALDQEGNLGRNTFEGHGLT